MGKEGSTFIGSCHYYQPPRWASHSELKNICTDPRGIDWTLQGIDDSYRPQTQKGIQQVSSFDLYGTLERQIAQHAPDVLGEFHSAPAANWIGDSGIHIMLPDLATGDSHLLVAARRAQLARHGINPTTFWAPESGLDNRTLQVLAANGYQFVLCAPEQIDNGTYYQTCLPTFIHLPNDRSIILLPFHRGIANALAFQSKYNADQFTDTHILPAIQDVYAQSRSVFGVTYAHQVPIIGHTDGETYGHHAPGADEFYRYLLTQALPQKGIHVTSIGRLNPEEIPTINGRLRERTAWSCPHGDLVRWHGECGCHNGVDLRWKGPFYHAVHTLNGAITDLIKKELGASYDQEVLINFEGVFDLSNRFLTQHQRLVAAKGSALVALTSCATFFADPGVSGNINLIFAAQAALSMRDAGLTKVANDIWGAFLNNMQYVHDPYNYARDGRQMIKELLGDTHIV